MNGRSVSGKHYYTLAVLALGCAYFALTPISALAQGAGGRGVSVTVNPTTGYSVINSQTIGTPRGTTIGPSGGAPSVTTRPGGGLSQSLPAGIEITGIRENAQTLRGPLGVSLNATASALRNGATRCLSSFRCTNVLSLTAIGLQQLLDTADWSLDDTGRPETSEMVAPPMGEDDLSYQYYSVPTLGNEATRAFTRSGACALTVGRALSGSNTVVSARVVGDECVVTGTNGMDYRRGFSLYNRTAGCPPGLINSPGEGCYSHIDTIPVPPSSISDVVDSNYNPHPSDWNWLSGGMNFSDPGFTVDITDLPVLDGSNEPNFIQNSDGTSRGTFNVYTPTASYNGTSRPQIEVRDEQTETNYDEQGNSTGSNTSTGTMTPNPGGSSSSPDIVIPTDCDFMPTVCRFIDWFTEPDFQPDPDQQIKDLVQVYEDGGRQVTVGPESGSCPSPRTIELSLVPSVEFSFQPFCDLATAVRFWLLAIASFSAAYMTVRSI